MSHPLRNMARDQHCYVRLSECCNHDPETVVLAHLRLTGISGMGHKAPDILACPACSHCHDAIDRRAFMTLDRDYVRLAHLEGIARWLADLERREIIVVVA